MNYFRYKQFDNDVITVAVGCYLRYALGYRVISEISIEREVSVYHSTVYCWVQEYAPILYQIWKKKHKKLIINGVSMRHISKLRANGAIYIVRLIQMAILQIFGCVSNEIIMWHMRLLSVLSSNSANPK